MKYIALILAMGLIIVGILIWTDADAEGQPTYEVDGEIFAQPEYNVLKNALKDKNINHGKPDFTTIEAKQVKDVMRIEGGNYRASEKVKLQEKAKNGTINKQEISTWIATKEPIQITNFSGSTEELEALIKSKILD